MAIALWIVPDCEDLTQIELNPERQQEYGAIAAGEIGFIPPQHPFLVEGGKGAQNFAS